MIRRLCVICSIVMLIELLSLSIDIFYFTYCRPIKYEFKTFVIRLVSKESTLCNLSNKIHNVLDKRASSFMLDSLHLL